MNQFNANILGLYGSDSMNLVKMIVWTKAADFHRR